MWCLLIPLYLVFLSKMFLLFFETPAKALLRPLLSFLKENLLRALLGDLLRVLVRPSYIIFFSRVLYTVPARVFLRFSAGVKKIDKNMILFFEGGNKEEAGRAV